MNKVFLAVLTAGILIFAPAAGAGLVEGWDFEVGAEVGHFQYRESHFMREYGMQYGGYLALGIGAVQPWYFQLHGSYVGGDITYDGGYCAIWGCRPLKGDSSNFIINFRGLAGYQLLDGKFRIMPYSGIGYRYLENDLRDLETKWYLQGLGYLRQQTYFYLPLGCELALPVSRDGRWELGLRGEFDWMFYGFHIADGIRLDNQSGWGFRLGPFLRRELDENIAFKLELSAEYWKIGDSDINRGFMEPANASNYYSCRLGLVF